MEASSELSPARRLELLREIANRHELSTAMIENLLERFREIFNGMDPLNTRVRELRRILGELEALGFEHVPEMKENLDKWVASTARRLELMREIANRRELSTETIENLRERFREIFRGFENPQNTSEETCTARFGELRRILEDLEVLRFDHVAEMKEYLDKWVELEAKFREFEAEFREFWWCIVLFLWVILLIQNLLFREFEAEFFMFLLVLIQIVALIREHCDL